MTKFSANLGFLWADLPLPQAIHAAKIAGFDAVECHWPFEIPASKVKTALDETGLPMMGLNTRRGDVAAGENGLCAVPGREAEAISAMEQALEYADAIGAKAVHVMAGNAKGEAARQVFIENLCIASKVAKRCGIDILIEPLNRFDAPRYFLRDTDQARDIIADVGASNLKLMFDCYHVGRTEGDVIQRLKALLPIIGHIQFASVPDRGTPDHGDVAYQQVFAALAAMGWDKPLGAEYAPLAQTEDSLDWLTSPALRPRS